MSTITEDLRVAREKEIAAAAATQVSHGSNRPHVWLSLPAELVGSIFACMPVPDFIRASAVCSSWNSVLTRRDNSNAHLPHPLSNSPWLLLPSSLGEADEALTFRSISDSRHYRFSSLSKYINGRICKGSYNGWLVTLDIPDLIPRLFNPVTKAEIYFPPLLTIPDDDEHKMRKLFFSVAIDLWAGLVIGFISEYFTSDAYSPMHDITDSCRIGATTNVIFGLALGYKLVIVPIFAIAISIFISFSLAAMYGITVAALGMLSTIAT